ncbi:MAG: hypothetical protein ACRENI_12605 [Gemmatimonadaceae bacterium]
MIRRHMITLGVLLVAAGCSDGDATTGVIAQVFTASGKCSPDLGGVSVDLSVGGVGSFAGAAELNCLALRGGNGSFLVIPANANALPDVAATFLVDIASIGVAGEYPSSPSINGPVDVDPLERALSPLRFTADFESRLRSKERRLLDVGEGSAAWRATRRTGLSPSLSALAVMIGDTREFRVPDNSTGDLCDNFITILAVARAVSNFAVVWEDTASSPNGFTSADYQAVAQEFDDHIYPTNVEYFGEPLDLDGNGKIDILYTPEVNKLTPSGSDGFVGGFFFGGDLFPRFDENGDPICEQSNESELFYLLAPDPTGEFGNVRTTGSVLRGTRGTVAHEFQHMINASVRLLSPDVQEFEDAWLNEGLSHFAEELVGRDVLGLDVMHEIAFADIAKEQDDFRDFDSFFFQNLARFDRWLSDPVENAPTSADAASKLAPRGAAWAFLRYAADEYHRDTVAAFTRALVRGPEVGVPNFVQHVGAPFEEILEGWMVANYADDFGIPGLSERYTYRSWDMRDAEKAINNEVYPLVPLRITETSPAVTITPISATGEYFLVDGDVADVFRVFSQARERLTYPDARVFVLRTQ